MAAIAAIALRKVASTTLTLFHSCGSRANVRSFVSYLTLSIEHKAYQLHDPSVL